MSKIFPKWLYAISMFLFIGGAALNITGLNSLIAEINTTQIVKAEDKVKEKVKDEEHEEEVEVKENSPKDEVISYVISKHRYYYLSLLVLLVVPVVFCVTLHCRSQRTTLVIAESEPHHISSMEVKVEHGEGYQFVVR